MRRVFWVLLSISLQRTHAADMYSLDPANTRISFNIQRFGVLWVSARFPDFSGAFVLDRHGSASRVDVSVQMASVACNDAHWNAPLRSADWLDVQHFPQMTFQSNQVLFDDDHRAFANGELTLHGVTHSVGLQIMALSCSASGAGADSCRFDAHARIRRSDYGLAHGFWSGGDMVDIAISGVGRRGALPPARGAATAATVAAAAALL